MEDTLDPRNQDEEPTTGLIEELVALSIDVEDATKILKLRKNLNQENSTKLTAFLKGNLDVFTWKHVYCWVFIQMLCVIA